MQIRFIKYFLFFLFISLEFSVKLSAQSNDALQKALRFADSVYQLKEYENAKSAYEYAGRFQENNAHITNRLNEIKQILEQQKEAENQYNNIVAAAKKAFYDNNPDAAHQLLKDAVAMKSDPNLWANQKLKEIEDEIARKAKLQQDYCEKMALGDKFFADKQYEDAEKEFVAALKFMPNDVEATRKLTETRTKIKERNTAYQQHITEGDRLYQMDRVSDAKVQYHQALTLKPNEMYPQQRIDFINAMEAEEADLEKRVATVVEEADQLFVAKNYEDSYIKYQAALDVYPGHQHAKDRMKEIDGILGEARAIQRAYDQAIASADKLLSEKRYPEAKIIYEKAQSLKPAESYPPQKINEIEIILAKQKSDEDAFMRLVANGDELYGKNQFEEAKTSYEDALKMRPTHADVQQKIIDTKAQIDKINKQYATLIAQADNQLRLKKFLDAQVIYEQSLEIKPNEAYPKQKIAEITAILSGQKEMVEQNYNDAMIAGNQFFQSGDFENAKLEYTKASRVKPAEQEPKDKLAAVEQALANQKQTDAQFAAFVKEGDSRLASKRWNEALKAFQNALALKNDETVKTKIAICESEIAKIQGLEDQFNQYVSAGDNYFSEFDWTNAKTAYQSALQIKSDKYLTEKIKEIDANLEKEENLEKQYQNIIAQADNQLKLKKYIDAQVSFETALGLKPDAAYPQEKLTEIANYLKDQQELLEKSYNEAMADGNNFMQAEDFFNAKASFTKASSIKPKEQEPKDKLADVEQAIARQKQTETQFATYVKEGDAKFAAQRWNEALTLYQNALELKSNEETIKTKVAACQTEIAKIAALENQYNQHIADGDAYFSAKDWNNAKTSYQKAIAIKSDRTLTDKIKEIDAHLLQEADAEKQYQAFIATADAKVAEQQWKLAADNYRNALNLKPEDEYATERLNHAEEQMRLEQELETKYQTFVSQGDLAMQQNSLNEAKTAYQSALTIKPDAEYPQSQLAVIEMKQQDFAKRRENYDKLLANAETAVSQQAWQKAKSDCSQALQLFPEENRPQELMRTIDEAIAQIEATNKLYNETIAHADAALSQQNREIALQQYQKASEIKPEEDYPKNKIKEINDAIVAAENREKEQQYNTFIDDANALIAKKIYKEAVSKLEQALEIKPNDEFATNKLNETKATIQRLADIEENYAKYIKDGDAQFNSKNYEDALDSYTQASKLKPEETYPKEQITKAQHQVDFSPNRRKNLAQESYNKGLEAMNKKNYQTASNAFATATMWYPEDISETQTALNQMHEMLISGKVKNVLNEKVNIATNTTYNIKTFVALDDLDAKSFIIIKVSGNFEDNTNIFLRYGRYTVTYGNSVLVAIAGANVAYYCIAMKGDKNDINWMNITPENNDIVVEEVTLVSPK